MNTRYLQYWGNTRDYFNKDQNGVIDECSVLNDPIKFNLLTPDGSTEIYAHSLACIEYFFDGAQKFPGHKSSVRLHSSDIGYDELISEELAIRIMERGEVALYDLA
tara:strand:+ start:401 stop:718 length:318 start_codon:yes stop_codon:yes gene_type:complete